MGLFSRRVKVGPLPPQANPYPSRLRRIRRPSSIVFAFLLIISYYAIAWIHPPIHHATHGKITEMAYAVSSYIARPFYEAKVYFSNSENLLSLTTENQKLKDENTKLKVALQNYAQTIIENKELKQFANLPHQISTPSKTLPVISIPTDGLHYSCIVKGGEDDGVEVNQVAISPEGVVGRIDMTTPHAARVLLVNSYQSKTPVYIPRISQNAIAVGDGSDSLVLTYLENAAEIQEGDEVFTSGLGGIYPRGLYVGKVSQVSGGEVRFRPSANLNALSYLHIFSNTPLNESEIRKLDEE